MHFIFSVFFHIELCLISEICCNIEDVHYFDCYIILNLYQFFVVQPPAVDLLETSQKMGDSLLEFLTFSSAASIGFERMAVSCDMFCIAVIVIVIVECHPFLNSFSLFLKAFQGRGKRVCQSGGPFVLEFNVMPREWRVYYQVDGEFYVMNNPAR